uniref:Reverse transcriptase domain-containing protein n=1 Tax=Tanacetum cinerariifolium TaxID=118510 RepID=A0A6L2MUY3_TANCI|nr:reverse transcriptase domain-containing protein [Tanacetum cinerariifolium]
MRTRSQSRNNFPQQEPSPVIVEPLRIELPFLEDQFQEDPPPDVPMADNRIMGELLQAPTEGYEDAIVIPEIVANNFELKHGLINLVQNKQFSGHDKEDPHAHIRYFNKITSTMRVRNVPRFIELRCGWKFLGLNSSRMLENHREQVQSSSITSQGSHFQTPAHSPTPAPVKAVEPNCVTCGGSGTLPSNTITNPKEELKGITTRSGVAYQGPIVPTPTPTPNVKSSIPYASRRDNERRRDQANEQIEKLYEIFKDMSFEISFTDALILMPKFASTLKALIGNKEKLSEMARTPMNEHCSAVILNKLPRKLRDPGKFLIPCEFPGMDECLALADLCASIILMPLSVWEALLLPELTPTCMTLELADRSVSKPIVKVGVFHFPADFVVVDFEPDPRVSLILRRCFLKTGRALIDVHKGELTLRIGNEAITYNLDQTSRYSAN